MAWLEGGRAGSEARRSSWVIGPDGGEARAPERVPPVSGLKVLNKSYNVPNPRLLTLK